MSMSGFPAGGVSPAAQSVVKFNVVGAANVNWKTIQGPLEPSRTTSGQMLALLCWGKPISIWYVLPDAGRRGVRSGAVCQELSPAQKSPVTTMFGATGSLTLSPGIYVTTIPTTVSVLNPLLP